MFNRLDLQYDDTTSRALIKTIEDLDKRLTHIESELKSVRNIRVR